MGRDISDNNRFISGNHPEYFIHAFFEVNRFFDTVFIPPGLELAYQRLRADVPIDKQHFMRRVQPGIDAAHGYNPDNADNNLQHCEYQNRRWKLKEFPFFCNQRQLQVFHGVRRAHWQNLWIQHIQIAQVANPESAEHLHKQDKHHCIQNNDGPVPPPVIIEIPEIFPHACQFPVRIIIIPQTGKHGCLYCNNQYRSKQHDKPLVLLFWICFHNLVPCQLFFDFSGCFPDSFSF